MALNCVAVLGECAIPVASFVISQLWAQSGNAGRNNLPGADQTSRLHSNCLRGHVLRGVPASVEQTLIQPSKESPLQSTAAVRHITKERRESQTTFAANPREHAALGFNSLATALPELSAISVRRVPLTQATAHDEVFPLQHILSSKMYKLRDFNPPI